MGRALCFWRPPLWTQLAAEISNAPQSPDQVVSVWTCWLWHLCGCACKKLNGCCKRSWGQTVEVDEEKDRAEVLWAGTWHLSLPPSQVASMIPWCWHQPVLPPLLTGGSFHLSARTTLALISQFPNQVWGFAWNFCIPKCVSSFLMCFRVVCFRLMLTRKRGPHSPDLPPEDTKRIEKTSAWCTSNPSGPITGSKSTNANVDLSIPWLKIGATRIHWAVPKVISPRFNSSYSVHLKFSQPGLWLDKAVWLVQMQNFEMWKTGYVIIRKKLNQQTQWHPLQNSNAALELHFMQNFTHALKPQAVAKWLVRFPNPLADDFFSSQAWIPSTKWLSQCTPSVLEWQELWPVVRHKWAPDCNK